MLDVAEKQEYQTIQEPEKRWRSLVESLPDIIYTVSPQGKITSLNPAFEKILGWKTKEWIGKEFSSLVHTDDLPVALERFQSLLRGESPPATDVRILTKSGFYVTLESLSISEVKNDQVVNILGISRDVTKRKQAEEAYLHLASLVEFSNDAVIGVTLDGIIVSWNLGAERLYGYKSDEVTNNKSIVSLLVPPNRRHEVPQILEKVKRGERIERFETKRLRKDGVEIDVSQSVSPVRNSAGKITGVSTIVRDITERLLLEKRILEISDREQIRLGQDLHDGLGQPLSGISYLCNALAGKLTDQSIPEAAHAARIAELIDDVISKIRDISRELYPVKLASDGLTAALQELAVHTEELSSISCQFRYARPFINLDNAIAMNLYRIAQEAVNNAVKHGKAKHVSIEITESGQGMILTVKDDGVGFRACKETTKGMGLDIMKYRARLIGASLDIQPGDTGAGTNVICSLQT